MNCITGFLMSSTNFTPSFPPSWLLLVLQLICFTKLQVMKRWVGPIAWKKVNHPWLFTHSSCKHFSSIEQLFNRHSWYKRKFPDQQDVFYSCVEDGFQFIVLIVPTTEKYNKCNPVVAMCIIAVHCTFVGSTVSIGDSLEEEKVLADVLL